MIFVHDTILDTKDICNLEREQSVLRKALDQDQKVLVFGKRNTGKTSIIQSVVIPYYYRLHPSGIGIGVNLLGIHSIEEIARRLILSFEKSLSIVFPFKFFFKKITKILKNLHPSITAQPDGSYSVSLSDWPPQRKVISLEEIFAQITNLQKNKNFYFAGF